MIFTYALLYCDSVLRENLDEHALRRSPLAGTIWVWMHPVLGFSLFIIGLSIKLSFYEVTSGYPVSNDHNYMLGLGCGFTVIILMIMRGTHKGMSVIGKSGYSPKSLKRVANYSFRITIAIAHFVVAAHSHSQPEVDHGTHADSRDDALYIHTALAVAGVFVEIVAARLNRKGGQPAPKGGHDHSHDCPDDDEYALGRPSAVGADERHNPMSIELK